MITKELAQRWLAEAIKNRHEWSQFSDYNAYIKWLENIILK